MRRYLITSITCLLIAIYAALHIGCATMEARPSCVPLSIQAAWTWGMTHKHPVRIAAQHISPGIDHAQAEALIDGKWIPLTQVGISTIIPHKRHFPVEPYRYMSLDEFIREQIRFTRSP